MKGPQVSVETGPATSAAASCTIALLWKSFQVMDEIKGPLSCRVRAAGKWQLDTASEVTVLQRGVDFPWDRAAISAIYAAKTPLATADVKSMLELALDVLWRDPEATVDPVPLRLREANGLMDWAQVGGAART